MEVKLFKLILTSYLKLVGLLALKGKRLAVKAGDSARFIKLDASPGLSAMIGPLSLLDFSG